MIQKRSMQKLILKENDAIYLICGTFQQVEIKSSLQGRKVPKIFRQL